MTSTKVLLKRVTDEVRNKSDARGILKRPCSNLWVGVEVRVETETGEVIWLT